MTWDDNEPAQSPWEAIAGVIGMLSTVYEIATDLWDRFHPEPTKDKPDEAESQAVINAEKLQEVLQDHEDRLYALEKKRRTNSRGPK